MTPIREYDNDYAIMIDFAQMVIHIFAVNKSVNYITRVIRCRIIDLSDVKKKKHTHILLTHRSPSWSDVRSAS